MTNEQPSEHWSKEHTRTCALCKRCTIELGERGYSDVTPGSNGSASCSKRHWNQSDGGVDLVQLAEHAKKCLDFSLIDLPERS